MAILSPFPRPIKSLKKQTFVSLQKTHHNLGTQSLGNQTTRTPHKSINPSIDIPTAFRFNSLTRKETSQYPHNHNLYNRQYPDGTEG